MVSWSHHTRMRFIQTISRNAQRMQRRSPMRLEVKEDVKKRMNNLLGEETEAYVRSDKLSEKLLRSDYSDLDFYRKWKESNYIQLTPPEISCPDDTSHIISAFVVQGRAASCCSHCVSVARVWGCWRRWPPIGGCCYCIGTSRCR